MKYCEVYLRGVQGIFSWETTESLSVGARVVVKFRNRKKIGIVLSVSGEKPDFATKPIEEIWDDQFVSEKYIDIAKQIAHDTFSTIEKVMSLMVPEKFLQKKDPVVRDVFYSLAQSSNSKPPDFELKVRGKKQLQAIAMLQKQKRVSAEELRKHISLATIKGLIEKGIVIEEKGAIKNIFNGTRVARPSFDLTPSQQKAFDDIQQSQKPTLLFGVTGSGKTEIYKKLAADLIEQDPTAQILFLLPEIALTSQLIAEFYAVFGKRLAVWHSKLSEGEKIQEYERIRTGEAQILIGTRSAVFVPLQNPKLVILDEEHEWTFKNEFSPRYWTHDVVQTIAEKHTAQLLFGTATPRLESYEKCEKGEWHSIVLSERVLDVKMPSIQFIDLVNEGKKGNHSPISEALAFEIEEMLKNKKQIVLFLNKRGYSGSTLCKSCGRNFECPHCSHNMKMHQRGTLRTFICHVCGHMERFPEKCPDCGAVDFAFKGWGTQMVEKILKEQFSGIRIFRADADSVSGKHDFDQLMNRFHNYEADILLGTQMIAKGLDFERVQLVGVILADVGLGLPDFRSEERVFQILTQVSGRAGRRTKQGHIIIQTFQPKEKIFEYVLNHDSPGFLEWQKEIREASQMPPFGEIAKITFSDVKKEIAFKNAKSFYEHLKKNALKDILIHFAPAFFPRTHNRYHFHVFIRTKTRTEVIDLLSKYELNKAGVKIDVSPVSLL